MLTKSNLIRLVSILIILATAAILRLNGLALRGGLEWDEISLWYESLSNFRSPYMAPLPPLLFGSFLTLVNSAEYYQFHLPSILAGTSACLLIFLATRAITGFWWASLSALLMAISPLGIYYSQEARHYALVQFFAAALLVIVTHLDVCRINTSKFTKTNLTLVLVTLLALLTHLVFAHLIVALCASLLLLIVLKEQNTKTAIITALSAIAGSSIGTIWIWQRPISESLSSGEFAHGSLQFIRSSFSALTTELNYSRFAPISSNDLRTFTLTLLVIVGITYCWKTRFRLTASFIVFSVCGSLSLLYLTMGEKADWSWFRYLAHLLPLVLLALTLGIKKFSCSLRSPLLSSTVIILTLLLIYPNPIKLFGLNEFERGRLIRLAHTELKNIKNEVDAVLIPEANWGYGVESERNLSYYFNHRQTELPTYYIEKNSIKRIQTFPCRSNLCTLTMPGSSLAKQLPKGRYALFPYGLLRSDGALGQNKPKCPLLNKFRLVNQHNLKRLQIKNRPSNLIETCQIY